MHQGQHKLWQHQAALYCISSHCEPGGSYFYERATVLGRNEAL